jgi:hypothetical protein
MQKIRLSLVGMPNQRNYDSLQTLISAKDQRFIGGIISLVKNPFSNSMRLYFEKRPGWETSSTPASGKAGEAVHFSRSQNKVVSAFSTGGTTTMYVGTTSIGTI